MIDKELPGNIKDKTDKDEDFFSDVPPEWLEGMQEEQRKKGEGCKRIFGVGALVSILVAAIVNIPTKKKLESEYKEFFEKPCLSNVERLQYRPDYSKIMRRLRDEQWRNQVKQEITDQAKRHDSRSRRKKIYEKHLKDCERLIGSGVVLDMNTRRFSPNKTRKKPQKPPSGRRTNKGVLVERGADIDYRIDSDKLINLSVRQIRLNGYRCNSLSSIDLYNYNKSIVVRCNEGKDKYRIYPSSGQVTRH